MRNIQTSSRVVEISEIIQWHENSHLELSPKYQRNSVWNDKAKSYLIDTIIRGFPIPPIFLRQRIDVKTKTIHREVIDGQQRLRAILDFIVDERITINRSTNPDFAGIKYSELSPDVQERILSYEILAVLVAEKDDSVIYDMFARLNSNNIILNRQELRNAKYWGEFKVFSYQMTSEIRDLLIDRNVFSDQQLSRMRDVEFVSSLIILMTEGIVDETPKYVDSIYNKYDKSFDNLDFYNNAFLLVFEVIEKVFELMDNRIGVFNKKNYLFTLFATLYHQMYGIIAIDVSRYTKFSSDNILNHVNELRDKISNFLYEWDQFIEDRTGEEHSSLSTFQANHSSRTTNKIERIKRIHFLSRYLE